MVSIGRLGLREHKPGLLAAVLGLGLSWIIITKPLSSQNELQLGFRMAS